MLTTNIISGPDYDFFNVKLQLRYFALIHLRNKLPHQLRHPHRKAGKMVFLRQRRQANAPNHCSHCMKSFIIVYGHAVAAMPFALIRRTSGHCKWFVVCHIACSSASSVTAATVSFTPLRSLLPSFRFITPRS